MIARADSTLDRSSSVTTATSVGKTSATDETYSRDDRDVIEPPDSADLDARRMCAGAR